MKDFKEAEGSIGGWWRPERQRQKCAPARGLCPFCRSSHLGLPLLLN